MELGDKDSLSGAGSANGQAQSCGCFPFTVSGINLNKSLHLSPSCSFSVVLKNDRVRSGESYRKETLDIILEYLAIPFMGFGKFDFNDFTFFAGNHLVFNFFRLTKKVNRMVMFRQRDR